MPNAATPAGKPAEFDLKKFAQDSVDFVDVAGQAIDIGYKAQLKLEKQAEEAASIAPAIARTMLDNRQIDKDEFDAAVKMASSYAGISQILTNCLTKLAEANAELSHTKAAGSLEVGRPASPDGPQQKVASAGGVVGARNGKVKESDLVLFEFARRHAGQ